MKFIQAGFEDDPIWQVDAVIGLFERKFPARLFRIQAASKAAAEFLARAHCPLILTMVVRRVDQTLDGIPGVQGVPAPGEGSGGGEAARISSTLPSEESRAPEKPGDPAEPSEPGGPGPLELDPGGG